MLSRLRPILVLVIGIVVIAFAANSLANKPEPIQPKDFVEYWSAGAVNLHGRNPYDPDELLHWQQLAIPKTVETVMMWNPPWSLSLYMPLGALPYRWGALIWLAIQIAAVMLSCDLLWRMFDGPARFRWAAQVVALSFVGTWWMISFGQNSGLLLLGLAGFAYFRKLDRPALAGAFAALTALKPHLLAVFGVLLILDGLTRRGRIVLAAGASVVVLSFGLALLANPDCFAQYREAVSHPHPQAIPLSGWKLPVASFWLRAKIAYAQFWIQFVPSALACVGYAIFRLTRRFEWDWSKQLPLIVWVSVFTTSYGGWIFDLPVLLVPLIYTAVKVMKEGPNWSAGFVFLIGQIAIFIVTQSWTFVLHEFFWVIPAVLLVDLVTLAMLERRRSYNR